MASPYHPGDIETKWQKIWADRKTFKVTEDPSRPKYYCLEMLPYPSGKIHMGHVRNYSIGDVIARYKRMRGFNVLHPMGWDAFGMPAENAAIERKLHPADWTRQNIGEMRRQLKRMGFSYDWDREVATCEPEYYRWEQLLFLKMFEKGLVYKKQSYVNWCDKCQTVLANEQVEGGCCWRCNSTVRLKTLEQWFFRITAYAKELLNETHRMKGWPEKVLIMQREWIGESQGAMVRFELESPLPSAGEGGRRPGEGYIEVFTTRPDTLYGATFMSLAAEYPLVRSLSKGSPQEAEINRFVEKVSRMDRTKRLAGEYEKEGVFTGAYCLNPVNGRRMPIYAANFVLMEYGTGAVMAVPAHDQRDFEFAKKYQLPIVPVIYPSAKEPLDALTMKEAFEEPGVMANSGPLDGIPSERAKGEIIKALGERGRQTTTYRLRDWGISRQRYWGAPIPILYCPNCGMIPVPEKDLPVVLPIDVAFTGEGSSPLAKSKSFLETPCPRCPGTARRETDTMDTFVESCWYFLRYCSPHYAEGMFDRKAVDYWMGSECSQPQNGVEGEAPTALPVEGATRAPGIDQYIGGIEHAVLHLLYARFFTKVLRDLGWIKISEPFANLLTQGMVIKDGAKMSKSKGNIVDPDYLIERYGADTARLFSLFAVPPEKDLDWNDQGVEGASRFLKRIWNLVQGPKGKGTEAETRLLHKTVKKVTEDLEKFQFNTAIAALMECYNGLEAPTEKSLETLVLLLSPFAPHIAEELWQALGGKGLVAEQRWPTYDEQALALETTTLVIQVNGVFRGSIQVPWGTDEERARQLALAEEKISQMLAKRKIIKTVYVPNRLINLVVQ